MRTRRSAAITARSRARPTVRSCIASWRPSSGSSGANDAALEHFRQAVALDPARREIARADRRDSREQGRARRRGEGIWRRARDRAERRCRASARRRSRADGAGAAAGRVPRDRRGAAGHARAIWRRSSASGSRRCSRRSRGRRCRSSPTSATTGRRPGSWRCARRRDGAVREPRVPAARRSSAASISRRSSRACSRAWPRPAARKGMRGNPRA